VSSIEKTHVAGGVIQGFEKRKENGGRECDSVGGSLKLRR
jgi:hypothetical protein